MRDWIMAGDLVSAVDDQHDEGQLESGLMFSDLTLDLYSYQIVRRGQVVPLTAKEFALMQLFMLHPGLLLTRQFLFENVWGLDANTESNVLEVYVRYLRKKTEQWGGKQLIHTVRGKGYVLREA
jgi:two-component system, OmpR family, response regulator MprA